jgi:DNA invertase Pin-like site-specific DNA recombinase
MTGTDSIQPFHRQRLALVYLRQSSPHQVLAHRESALLQQRLSPRAEELGWPASQVRVLDADLGRTGRTAQGRCGLEEVRQLVSFGQVGLLLAREVNRLIRNCSDWYPILDLCAYHHCLVGDEDGLYDPALPNDRMLLGMKGLISEWELHTLHLRLTAGLRNKAQRGDLAQTLPIGFVRDALGQVQKFPDQEVQDRLTLVFTTFLRLRSLPAVLRFFYAHDLTLPGRDRGGVLVWRRPTPAALSAILKNPAYAGAFVRGRTRSERAADAARRPRQRALPRDQWDIVVRDKYPAYLDWPTFEKIQDMLQDNHANYQEQQARGVPRAGQALLHGLVCCGVCGHRLVVQYKHGIKYICNYHRRHYQEPVCQYLPAAPVDAWVAAAFLEALTPAACELDAQVLAAWQQDLAALERAQQQQRERLQYQAQLAERQYRLVDPANRLVAAELEQRWEEALQALRDAEAAQQAATTSPPLPGLSPELRAALAEVGTNLAEWWRQGRIALPQQKALLRCLVDKVVLHRTAPDRVAVRLVWKGGATSEAEIGVPVQAWARLSEAVALEKEILKLAKSGWSDAAIAERLTQAGHRSPRRGVFLPSTVLNVRLRHRLFRRRPAPARRQRSGYLTVAQLAQQLQVAPHWIYDRIHNGTIRVPFDGQRRIFLFPDRPQTLSQFQQLLAGKLKKLHF